MSRNLSALFKDEVAALEQSQVLHLMVVEITKLGTASITAGSTTLNVSSLENFDAGQYITIEGVDGIKHVQQITSSTLLLNTPADVTVSNADVYLVLPIADSNYAVTFDGIVYVQFPAKFSDISVNSDGTIDKATLSIANVSREIMYYVEMYNGLRDRIVTIKTVMQRFLDYRYDVGVDGVVRVYDNPEADVSAYVEDSFRIDSYVADENTVTFNLDPSVNFSVKIPFRRYTSDSCYWRYRDPQTCKFDLDAWVAAHPLEVGVREKYSVCQKNFAACQERANTLRFGAFPGILGQRRIYL